MTHSISSYLAKIKHKYSLLAIIVFVLVAFTHRDSFRTYTHRDKVVVYDMGGYYSYLPALFIYQDNEFLFLKNRPKQFQNIRTTDSKGNTVLINKYSIGPAILITPFFLLGHLESYYQQVPRDGYSYSYLFWAITGILCYVVLALFLLRSVLLRYYNDAAVATTLLGLSLGTNLFFYSIYEFMMSHAYSFFLFSLALYLSIRWFETKKRRTMLALAFTCGILAVTRLPNMVFFLVIVFWGVHSKDSLIERLLLYKKHWVSVGLGLLVFLTPFIPQMLYWYSRTGYFIINSYSSNNEHFYFTKPMIAEVLIGYRKGWLIYAPILIFGFLGFRTLYKQQKEIFWVLFLYVTINIYVVASWHSWWYGGGFGMRALIECSVALSLPMTAFIQHLSKHPFTSHLTNIMVTTFICLNLFQSYQYNHGIIHCAAMSRKAYWAVFGVTHPAHLYHLKQRDKYLIMPQGIKEANRKVYQQTIW